MYTGLHTSPEQSSSQKTSVFEAIIPDVFQLDEVQRNVGFDYNDLISSNSNRIVSFFATCYALTYATEGFPAWQTGLL